MFLILLVGGGTAASIINYLLLLLLLTTTANYLTNDEAQLPRYAHAKIEKTKSAWQ